MTHNWSKADVLKKKIVGKKYVSCDEIQFSTLVLNKVTKHMAKKQKTVYDSATDENAEGYPAWQKSAKERFTQLMMTGAVANTYYMNEDKMLKSAMKTIFEVVKEDPKYAAQEAIKGRKEGFMRTLPIVAVSRLSVDIENEDEYESKLRKEAFKEAFKQVIQTPRDLESFTTITRSYRGLGRKVKREMNRYIIDSINSDKKQFYAMKYRNQLKTAAQLAHPKTSDPLVDYVFGKDIDFDQYEQLKAYETFKGEDDLSPEEYVNLITKHRLEMQTCIGIRQPTPEVWKALGYQMSIFQLIKNLATLERHIGEDETLKIAKAKISIPTLQKGKVLPFRVLQAYDMIQGAKLKRFLGDITNEYPKSYDWSNLGRVCLAPDISGSMTSEIDQSRMTCPKCGEELPRMLSSVCPKCRAKINPAHIKSARRRIASVKPSKVAGMLTGIMYFGIKDSVLLPWSDEAYHWKKDPKKTDSDEKHDASIRSRRARFYAYRDDLEYTPNTVIDLAARIDHAAGGGTNMGAPVQWLLDNNQKIDTLIIVTDSEEWGSPWLDAWKLYLARVNMKAKAVLIRVDPYPTNPFPPEAAEKYNITQIYGWNADSIFRILGLKEESE